jgi:hypothetical protein
MKKTLKRTGSALLLAVIIVVLIAGLGGAFLAVTTARSKTQYRMTESNEAQQICDAGIEMARAAMLQWRGQDVDTRPPAAALDPMTYAWNRVFKYCDETAPGSTIPLGMGATANPDVIKADAMARFAQLNSTGAWQYPGDNPQGGQPYNYDTVNTPQTLQPPSSGITPGIEISNLFCINRRYGKGAFHLALKNNADIHGDGVDNGAVATGNPWLWDPPRAAAPPAPAFAGDPVTAAGTQINFPSGTYTGSGQFDKYIDGDGQAILIVTATLPDGTQHQVEVLLGFPFSPGGPMNAIQDAGNITMNGAFTVAGTLGNVYAGGDISGNGGGQANVSGMVGAAGTNSLKMNNTPPGGLKSGVDTVPITPVDVTKFLTDPKYSALRSTPMYYFDKTGLAWDMSQPTPTSVSTTGFKFSSGGTGLGTWSISGKGSTLPGVYYFDGNFSMTGQGNGGPYQMTIIATGSVEIGGNAQFLPPTGVNDLIIAGQDIFLHGTGTAGGNQFTGNAFANEQVKIQGNFTLNGSITGANATDTPGSLVSSQSSTGPDLTLGGTPNITYNGFGSVIRQDADHLNVNGLRRLR